MTRSTGRGISNAVFLSEFGYCLAGEGVAPTADLHGRYPPSTAAPACITNKLRDQYDPKPMGDASGVKVFLTDDHWLLVADFRNVLKDYGIDVVEAVYNLDRLIDRFLEVKLDILVVDVRFDSKDCDENEPNVCEELLARGPSARIIAFSQFDSQYIIRYSYKLGMPAFVRKDESTEVLNETINTIAQGREYLSSEIARLLARSTVKDRNPSRLLDENEMQASSLAADGASMTEITTVTGLSTETIDRLVKGVKVKLGVESQANTAKLTIRHGIMTITLKTRS